MLEYFSCSDKSNAQKLYFLKVLSLSVLLLTPDSLIFFFIFTLLFCTWFFLFGTFLSSPCFPIGVAFSVSLKCLEMPRTLGTVAQCCCNVWLGN